MKTKHYPSRQVRRAAERKANKRLSKKGRKHRSELQERNHQNRKENWKYVVDLATRILSLIWQIINFFK